MQQIKGNFMLEELSESCVSHMVKVTSATVSHGGRMWPWCDAVSTGAGGQ